MSDLDEMVGVLNKKYGMGTAVDGHRGARDPNRLPSGIFPLDYVMGGGFAINQVGVLVGPEHGGKSSTALNLLQMVPRICWRCFNIKDYCKCSQGSLSMRSVWADVEGKFNGDWAAAIGARPDDYVVVRADDGNQYGDIICDAMRADDCGLVVVDSIAALIPAEMADATLEDRFIANQALLVRNMMLKIINRLTKEMKREHPCLVVFTNQIRSKIGVMFGSNETMAGGHFARYAPSIIMRMAKRALQQNDKEKYTDKDRGLLLAQKHVFRFEKYSNLRLGDEGEYIRAVEDINTDKVSASRGDILDHKTFITQIEKADLMIKSKNGFEFDGRVGPKSQFIDEWTKNRGLYYQDQITAIKTMKDKVTNNGK